MRFGFSKGNDFPLLKRGCAKVFKTDLDAISAMTASDELVVGEGEMTDLIKSVVDEYPETYKVLKAEDLKAGLDFDQEQTIDYLKAQGYSQSEIAKAMRIDEETVGIAKVFNEARIAKAYLKPSVQKRTPTNAQDALENYEALLADYIKKTLPGGVTKASTADVAEQQLEKAAEEIRKIEPTLTKEQALTKAYAENPELTRELV
ncbi:MAG: hypothetical protein ACYC10_20235 [Allorhizobium sp.]